MPKDRIGPFARRYFSMSLRFWNSESFLPFLVFCHTFSILFIPFVFDLHLFFPFLLSLQEFMLKCECPVQIMWLIWLWYKCIVWISRISYSWHSQSSARRANQAHCKGKESCSQLPVAKTKLAVTTKRSRFLDQILPRPVPWRPKALTAYSCPSLQPS